MGSTLIFVHYNGEWDDNNNYREFQVVGVSIEQSCNYEGLNMLIGDRIRIKRTNNHLILKYQLKDGYPPILVDDEWSFEFYKNLKAREHDYSKFPLCVTLSSKTMEPTNTLPVSVPVSRVGPLNLEKAQRLRDALEVGRNLPKLSFIDFANDAADVLTKEMDVIASKKPIVPSEREDAFLEGKEDGDVRVGQLFLNVELLKQKIQLGALTEKYNLRVVKSCNKQYYVGCVDDKCSWFMKSSVVGKSSVFKVRKLCNIHTCSLDTRMNEQRQATSHIISECIKSKFSNIKTIYTPADIIRDMKDQYEIDINYKKAWRSKRKAVDNVRGKPDESYQMVSRYLELLTDANPGSFVNVHVTDDKNFKFLFMSLFASIEGWQYCRPIVIVDGTYLKASYGGTLLTASVQDGNGHILPIAFAIVDSENDLAYEWFFENLKKAIGTRPGMSIVSDRNESLVKAATKFFPGVAQCFCMFHLGNNVKKHFKTNAQVVRQKFIAAAKAYNVDEFNKNMEELKVLDNRVVEYLKDVGFKHWARAHCPHNRFLSMTSNAAETINAVLRSARELPVTTLLECLRAMQQKWNVANGDEARSTFTFLTKVGHDMVEENYKLSFRMTVNKASDNIYQVSIGTSIFVVDLAKKTCTCNRFQLDELPCPHALSVLRGRHEDPMPYCSKYYYKDNMVDTYKEVVYPVSKDGSWGPNEVVEDDVVLPPIGRGRSGRSKKRIASVGEYPRKKRKTTCSRCGETGHNVKTCRNPPAQ